MTSGAGSGGAKAMRDQVVSDSCECTVTGRERWCVGFAVGARNTLTWPVRFAHGDLAVQCWPQQVAGASCSSRCGWKPQPRIRQRAVARALRGFKDLSTAGIGSLKGWRFGPHKSASPVDRYDRARGAGSCREGTGSYHNLMESAR